MFTDFTRDRNILISEELKFLLKRRILKYLCRSLEKITYKIHQCTGNPVIRLRLIMFKTLQLLASYYCFCLCFTAHHDSTTISGVAYAAFEPICDRFYFVQFGIARMLTIPSLPVLLLSKDITISNSESPINHPFKYSTVWIGTSLPLLDISTAVKQAELITTSDDGKPQHLWEMGRWPDPILRRSADAVDTSLFGSDILRQACDILRNTAVAEGAVGLAAQQCGVNARIIYLEVPLQQGRSTYMIMINPQILDRSPELEMVSWRESCLVLPPTFQTTVLRDAWVDVSYYGIGIPERKQKNSITSRRIVRLYGQMARAIQHEMDHDRGILVTDHVSLEELESDLMRSIEQPGHEQRMQVAYSRNW